MITRISYLTDIHLGFNAIQVLGNVLNQLGVYRPMIVTDPGLETTGILDRLQICPNVIFTNVDTNPSETCVIEGVQEFNRHECDGIVAVGGGSPIDLAKAVALLVHHPAPLAHYAFIRGGLERITANKPPLVAVPTTAGTGSEVGRAALITLREGEKLALISKHLIPDTAICDPLLTLTMPTSLTAATGMDALSHCIETFCSPLDNPVADAIALDGLERGFRHIQLVTNEPEHRQGRLEMMTAALQGGLTFQKGLGAVHALSHPLGALPNKQLHHGMLNAVFLPHVLRFNQDVCQRHMQIMANRLNLDDAGSLPEVFAQLVEDLGLPTTLTAMGVCLSDLEPLINKAMADHCCQSNPRPITPAQCRDLYTAAL